MNNIICCLTTLTVIFFFYAQLKFLLMRLLIISVWYFDMPLPGSVFSTTTGNVFSYQCKTWQLQIAMSPHPVTFPLPFESVLYIPQLLHLYIYLVKANNRRMSQDPSLPRKRGDSLPVISNHSGGNIPSLINFLIMFALLCCRSLVSSFWLANNMFP